MHIHLPIKSSLHNFFFLGRENTQQGYTEDFFRVVDMKPKLLLFHSFFN